MKVSSVSPDLWLVITPQPAAFDIFTASMDSLMVPIWFTCWCRTTRQQAGQDGQHMLPPMHPPMHARPDACEQRRGVALSFRALRCSALQEEWRI